MLTYSYNDKTNILDFVDTTIDSVRKNDDWKIFVFASEEQPTTADKRRDFAYNFYGHVAFLYVMLNAFQPTLN